jgi:hypothetical protein
VRRLQRRRIHLLREFGIHERSFRKDGAEVPHCCSRVVPRHASMDSSQTRMALKSIATMKCAIRESSPLEPLRGFLNFVPRLSNFHSTPSPCACSSTGDAFRAYTELRI